MTYNNQYIDSGTVRLGVAAVVLSSIRKRKYCKITSNILYVKLQFTASFLD